MPDISREKLCVYAFFHVRFSGEQIEGEARRERESPRESGTPRVYLSPNWKTQKQTHAAMLVPHVKKITN